MIRIANAPCSWGALEFDLNGGSPEYMEVLSEMKETGYEGTELGDLGFMPTRSKDLYETLHKFDLQLLGAFVPVDLSDSDKHAQGTELAIKTARLMYNAGYENAFIVLADDNGSVPERTQNAGRISNEMGLDHESWKIFRVVHNKKPPISLRNFFRYLNMFKPIPSYIPISTP